MLKRLDTSAFPSLNRAYNSVFRMDRLTVGLVAPIEAYPRNPVPTMSQHIERAQMADDLGFAAVWLRDVPFNVHSFGDAGQVYDPFVYLGLLAGRTERIALGVASIVLPLRHPAHVAKAAASVDELSGGRLLLGVASGDRPDEYPALNIPFEERGERFRESLSYIRQVGEDSASAFENFYGSPEQDMDLLPKPRAGQLPLLVTGGSRQHPDWVARNSDGWMTYPRAIERQAQVISDWCKRVDAAGEPPKPVMQPLYVDLADDPETPPQTIHLGFRLGTRHLHSYLSACRDIGVNHVALNLRFNTAGIETTLKHLADEILPDFSG